MKKTHLPDWLTITLCTMCLLGACSKPKTAEYSLVQEDSATYRYRCAWGEGVLRLVAVTDSTSRLEHTRNDSIVSSWTLNYPVYRFTCGDVTGDSIPEIIVGPVKATRYRREKDKRLFIFHLYKGTHIRPLWLGSRVGCPLIDFKVETDTMPNMIHTWERKNNGDTIEVLYRQYGFGLKFVRYITNKENKQ
ncbi:MAG: nuclear receptor-binding factor 2 [Bacteroidaceae bacterium]|nr:nuclear receptor-binding factor 2 [Bacteroidaceae bacterium]